LINVAADFMPAIGAPDHTHPATSYPAGEARATVSLIRHEVKVKVSAKQNHPASFGVEHFI
jgi:hypothetical protein